MLSVKWTFQILNTVSLLTNHMPCTTASKPDRFYQSFQIYQPGIALPFTEKHCWRKWFKNGRKEFLVSLGMHIFYKGEQDHWFKYYIVIVMRIANRKSMFILGIKTLKSNPTHLSPWQEAPSGSKISRSHSMWKTDLQLAGPFMCFENCSIS